MILAGDTITTDFILDKNSSFSNFLFISFVHIRMLISLSNKVLLKSVQA